MRRNSEKGFSLIELSIVLIIIGLLIAGITGGASLVKSATVRTVIAEANSFNSAINAYYAKRNFLPGDEPNHPGVRAQYAGSDYRPDGNGRVEFLNASGFFEGVLVWHHMFLEDIIEDGAVYYPSGQPGFNGANVETGDHMPASKLNAAGWVVDFRDNMSMLVLSNPIGFGADFGLAPVDGTLPSGNIISPENAMAIDEKIDDGLSADGKVRGYVTSVVNPVATDFTNETMDYNGDRTPSGHIGFALSL